MAVDQVLLDQVLKLDETERRELAQLLLSTLDDEDDLSEDERVRLHAALDRSLEEVAAGHVVSAHDVLDELRARHRP